MITPIKGRGAPSQPPGRFETRDLERVDDGWHQEPLPESIATSVQPEQARSVITRNDSPDIAFDQSINPYRGCEHGCVYCLDGDTRILMADGRTKSLATLAVGDEIVGTELSGRVRRGIPTTVLAKWPSRKAAWQVTTHDGTTLIASGDHRLLTKRGWLYVAPADDAMQCPCLTLDDSLIAINGPDSSALKIAAVERISDVRDLYDITTGTGDFIANGVVSHNCYARPSHAYVGLSPGLDFETKLFYKADAAARLREELGRRTYVPRPIMFGANTDPYQPIERHLRVTRSLLEVMAECRHPVSIVTKGALIARDIDLLQELARERLVAVMVSLTTLDENLKRRLEPRAASARARLGVIRALREAGVPVGTLIAPVIPALTDHEVEALLGAAAEAGAQCAGYVVLRLPYELADLFREWLAAHYPQRAAHVMSRVHSIRAGRDNDPCFGTRMKGQGVDAQLLKRRFEVACRRLGLENRLRPDLDTTQFRPPSGPVAQMQLGL